MADDLLIQRVKEASDIVDVVGEYLSLTKKGRTFKALCPFHDDHHPSMDVDPQRQAFTCWACGKRGDVFTFIMEYDRLTFPEALKLLAQRANIELKPGDRAAGEGKHRLYEVMAWAAERFQLGLAAAPNGAARDYLAQRQLTPETIEKYQLGYAPPGWDWLAQQAKQAKVKPDELEKLGLCSPRQGDGSLYDLFRDRIIFPIRDGRGRVIAFGGRILPGSTQAPDGPKYYNSRESPLFVKSQHFYGLDRARPAAEKCGYLAVVEGYTDVLMAHQQGVLPVVATLGTALNGQHLENLRKFVRRVVLVYDADQGGRSGIDRALTLFIQNEIDLAIAVLPEGQDPCDYLLAEGAEAFRTRLETAKDALEFVLDRELTPDRLASVAGRQAASDEVLRLMALIPPGARSSLELRKQLAISRMAQQVGVDEKTLWQRLEELRPRPNRRTEGGPKQSVEAAPPATVEPLEKELLGVLLAEPARLPVFREWVVLEEIKHPGIKAVLVTMVELLEGGGAASFDQVRLRLADRPKLLASMSSLYEESLAKGRLEARAGDVLAELKRRRELTRQRAIRVQLKSLSSEEPVPVELYQALQRTTHEE